MGELQDRIVPELELVAFSYYLWCPGRRLSIEQIEDKALRKGESAVRIRGCGRELTYRCTLDSKGGTHCLHEPRNSMSESERAERIRQKAGAQLTCEWPDVKPIPEGHDRYSAIGCGKRLDYECVSGRDCCAFVEPGIRAIDDPVWLTPLEQATAFARKTRQVSDHVDETPSGHVEKAQSGRLSKALIRAIIGKSVGDVRACYEKSLGAPPLPVGVVEVKFVIGPTGKVQTAALSRSSIGIASVERCIVESVQGLEFPAPENNGIVVVTYPFSLDTEDLERSCP